MPYASPELLAFLASLHEDEDAVAPLGETGAFTLTFTVAVLYVAELRVIVTVGTATVLAVAVAGWPAPASFTAVTDTCRVCPLPNPVSVVAPLPSVTLTVLPPADTTYLVIARPFSGGACQVTLIAPA